MGLIRFWRWHSNPPKDQNSPSAQVPCKSEALPTIHVICFCPGRAISTGLSTFPQYLQFFTKKNHNDRSDNSTSGNSAEQTITLASFHSSSQMGTTGTQTSITTSFGQHWPVAQFLRLHYLWQLGLQAGLLCQSIINRLQETSFYHIKCLKKTIRETEPLSST